MLSLFYMAGRISVGIVQDEQERELICR